MNSREEDGWNYRPPTSSSYDSFQDERAEQANSNQSLSSLPNISPILSFYLVKRHLTAGNRTVFPPGLPKLPSWRFPTKLKMNNGLLLLCLNLDVDPPDVVKTNPCAVLECWVDPHSLPSNKAIEAIGTNLQHQFEALNPRMKYKPLLDPSVDDARKFCINLRKLAQDERVLFYYNGHGVPKPTPSGELWVFNKSYSQYIPVSLWDLQNWLGSPCVYVWDTSSAGYLLENCTRIANQRDQDIRTQHGGVFPEGTTPFSDCLQLAACSKDEQLSMCPDLPADLFTSCLTSPIETAIRWFLLKSSSLPIGVDPDMVMQIPGDLKDRRTPLGELNWIFTAVTDTIAWTTFPRETFKELFRRDLLVAALFRNFLLAERIMKNYHCTPFTYPSLPPTNTHPMWAAWDLAVDTCVAQLPRLLARNQAEPCDYVPSSFFADSLTAFDVWLSRGGCALTPGLHDPDHPAAYPDTDPLAIPVSCDATYKHSLVPRRPPDQLPIVLQVLLAQGHRLRALICFAQFCDLGPWAVNLAMTIGIFPYMVKLLQAQPGDVRPVLIFIWARIIAISPSVRNELLTTNHAYRYFIQVLVTHEEPAFVLIPNVAEHRAMCAFILASVARGSLQGQTALISDQVLETCLERLADSTDYLLRKWVVLCLAQLWAQNDAVKDHAIQRDATEILLTQLADEQSPDVRAAIIYALATFLGTSGTNGRNEMDDLDIPELGRGSGGAGSLPSLNQTSHYVFEPGLATTALLAIRDEGSPIVRKELVILLSALVHAWRGHFIVCAWVYWEEERYLHDGADGTVVDKALASWRSKLVRDSEGGQDWVEVCEQVISGYFTLWSTLLELASDPFPGVAELAQMVVDWVVAALVDSPFAKLPDSGLSAADTPATMYGNGRRARVPSLTTLGSIRTPLQRTDSYTSTLTAPVSATSRNSTLKRTSSFAHALKSLGTYAFPPLESFSRPPSPGPPRQRSPPQELEYEAVDVIEVLLDEDMQRLRARRDGKKEEMPDSDVLPLTSRFYDWCNEYFTEPQMRQAESNEPGSTTYNRQLWRRSRNEDIIAETHAQGQLAPDCTWDRPVSTLHASSAPIKIALHAFDTLVVSADEHAKLRLWDWARRKCVRMWDNHNPKTSTITSLRFINDDTDGLVVAGSSDGVVRVWRPEEERPQLLGAFRALPGLILIRRGPGLVLDWSQAAGALVIGGDSKDLVVWDATSETKAEVISTQSNSPLTAVVSDLFVSSIIVAGFADGAIKTYDRRMRDNDAVVRTYREHASWIVGARCQRNDSKTLVTASMDGEVHLWDARNATRSVMDWHMQGRVAGFDLHEQTHVFATTSTIGHTSFRTHTTTIHSLPPYDSRVLSRVPHPTGLHHMPSSHHHAQVQGSVVFHPNEMLYATGSVDGTIRLLGCQLQEATAGKERVHVGVNSVRSFML